VSNALSSVLPSSKNYQLTLLLLPPQSTAPEVIDKFTCVTLFPWSFSSAKGIWDGAVIVDDFKKKQWRAMVAEWMDVALFGGMGGILITNTRPGTSSKRLVFVHDNVSRLPLPTVVGLCDRRPRLSGNRQARRRGRMGFSE
jgi:hypothetical protein